tara:strand:- start:8535 stop:8810 length:276 start_codon:yes stop_codon:yes gene_type:complete
MILYAITPALGALRNYSKYKQFQIELFIRTPITYLLIYKILSVLRVKNNTFMILILERWVFLVFKTILSFINDDYNIKKEKYRKKYGLLYP